MVDKSKPSYTELVYRVVRELPEPLLFDAIIEKINDILPITTKNPKSTIRNAISQSKLIVSTGDGRYGWMNRLVNGAVLRILLSETNLAQHVVTYTDELRNALWPAFFEGLNRRDIAPIHLRLPDGNTIELPVDHMGGSEWGNKKVLGFWSWLEPLTPRPGDSLIFKVLDGEARLASVEFERVTARDETAVSESNQRIITAVEKYTLHNPNAMAIWEFTPRLLAQGAYLNPVPPDPLEKLMDDLVGAVKGLPDFFLEDSPESDLADWFPGIDYEDEFGEDEVDPLVASLAEQASQENLPRRSARTPTELPLVYQIKITLAESSPPIWRRFKVPADISLPRLHAVCQIVMGWTNSHLHDFVVNKKIYAEPDPYGILEPSIINERKIILRQIAPGAGVKFVYNYDFGDSWEHVLVVEKVLPVKNEHDLPKCTSGKRACPPEDVGGVPGYENFLEAMSNRKHPDHAEYLRWIGGKFDPEAFDLQWVNDLLWQFEEVMTH